MAGTVVQYGSMPDLTVKSVWYDGDRSELKPGYCVCYDVAAPLVRDFDAGELHSHTRGRRVVKPETDNLLAFAGWVDDGRYEPDPGLIRIITPQNKGETLPVYVMEDLTLITSSLGPVDGEFWMAAAAGGNDVAIAFETVDLSTTAGYALVRIL